MAGSYRPEIASLKSAYRSNPTLFSFPENKTGHSILFVFKEYDYRGYTRQDNNPAYYSQRTRAGGRSLASRTNVINTTISGFGSVELPFPKQLQDNTSVRINAFEREAITESIVNTLNNQGAFEGGLGQNAMNQIGKIADVIQDAGAAVFSKEGRGNIAGTITGSLESILNMDSTNAARAATYLVRTLSGKLSGDISRTIDMVTGQTVNPKEALSFEGVDIKSHGFTWELYPSNRQETETIDKIVKLFKRNALPETQDLIPGVFEQTFLKYPSTVEIKLLGTNPKYFPTFKPCMIKSVNVSYENAAGTVPIMQGGVPGSVTLSVELQEMSAHTRDDVEPISGSSSSQSITDTEGPF